MICPYHWLEALVSPNGRWMVLANSAHDSYGAKDDTLWARVWEVRPDGKLPIKPVSKIRLPEKED